MSTDKANPFQQFLKAIESNHQVTYGENYSLNLSAVKLKILNQLWDSGLSFPREWVLSEKLLKLTGQKYFDRRIRELRDETGCDIETGVFHGQAAYRLRSCNLQPVNQRSYLTTAQKTGLLEQCGYKCSACGRLFTQDKRGLEADHKIPLSRNGGSNIENWQTLCVDCNVSKRRSCQNCQDECRSCAWAFPEQFGSIITIRLSLSTIERLHEEAKQQGKHHQDLLKDYIELGLAKKHYPA